MDTDPQQPQPQRRFLDRRDPERAQQVTIPSALERHMQSAMLMIAVSLLGWGLATVADLSRSATKLSVQVAELKENVYELQTKALASYPATDAFHAFQVRDQTLLRMDDRLRAIEQSVHMLQGRGPWLPSLPAVEPKPNEP